MSSKKNPVIKLIIDDGTWDTTLRNANVALEKLLALLDTYPDHLVDPKERRALLIPTLHAISQLIRWLPGTARNRSWLHFEKLALDLEDVDKGLKPAVFRPSTKRGAQPYSHRVTDIQVFALITANYLYEIASNQGKADQDVAKALKEIGFRPNRSDKDMTARTLRTWRERLSEDEWALTSPLAKEMHRVKNRLRRVPEKLSKGEQQQYLINYLKKAVRPLLKEGI